ncbi:Terminal nucleotidyltransferase 5B [Plecturocebus cupreus]
MRAQCAAHGSAASHVLHPESGLGYKDLDLGSRWTCATDRWSLISLSNKSGKNVELKFVDSVRQFEFSIDSFQIILTPVALWPVLVHSMSEVSPNGHRQSLYGDFAEALSTADRVIATESRGDPRWWPLKYCHLLGAARPSTACVPQRSCAPLLHRLSRPGGQRGTVCLMNHERRQTLGLIAALALQALAEQGPAATRPGLRQAPTGLAGHCHTT